MTPTLETPRLILKPFELADAEQIQPLFSQWEIVKYLAATVPWPYPADGAHTWMRDRALPAMERGEAWHWTLRPRNEPLRVIGAIGLMRNEVDHRGFWLAREWQGQGLMLEAVEAVTDFWFNTLKFPLLRTGKAAANIASRQLSVKTGMRLVGAEERSYVSGRLPTDIWEITAEEWNARHAR